MAHATEIPVVSVVFVAVHHDTNVGLLSTAIFGVGVMVVMIAVVALVLRAERFARRLARLPKIGHNLAEFWRAIWMYRMRPRAVAIALLLSLVSQSCNVLAFRPLRPGRCAMAFGPMRSVAAAAAAAMCVRPT